MDNKVYYGEYSLKHWIELILKKNIILPPYQRLFVWNEKDVKSLIEAFRQDEFVPPIIVGAFKGSNDINQNLIIDGQQRLTSLLLAYLRLFPDKEKYKQKQKDIYDSNTEGIDAEEYLAELDNILEWQFTYLTDKGRSKNEILKKIEGDNDDNYKKVEYDIDDEFLKSKFLGFSYLVPDIKSKDKTQQKYYSTVFRNINVQGKTLSLQESRASLYFLSDDIEEEFFNPKFIQEYKLKISSSTSKIDFVKYLSLLSQYKKSNTNVRLVAKYYGNKFEEYYKEYIYLVVEEKDSQMFVDFKSVFLDKKYKDDFLRLEKTINELDIPKEYPSIIDTDLFFFGLIYLILFEKKEIDVTKKIALNEEIKKNISELKNDSLHAGNPNALKYMRERLIASVNIYKGFKK